MKLLHDDKGDRKKSGIVPLDNAATKLGYGDYKQLMLELSKKGIQYFRREGVGWCMTESDLNRLQSQKHVKDYRPSSGPERQ